MTDFWNKCKGREINILQSQRKVILIKGLLSLYLNNEKKGEAFFSRERNIANAVKRGYL